MTPKPGIASLADLARELRINKSKLLYYLSLGLLKPVGSEGKRLLFHKAAVKQLLVYISVQKKLGAKNLKEVKISLGKRR